MIIAIASGKGGTGKTTIAVSLAIVLSDTKQVCFLDCDVEAPNAHLSLKPEMSEKKHVTLPIPKVDMALCSLCGTCAQVCQYHAIAVAGRKVLVFPEICHGCGSCTLNCPEGAIHEIDHPLGILQAGTCAGNISFANGLLDIGQPLSVPIIHQLRRWDSGDVPDVTIIDSPPGASCPMVESIHGADYVILVTEPTPFGLHDLRLAHEVTRLLGIPAGVVINRDGIGDAEVDAYCQQEDLPILMRIPLDRALAAGLAAGRTMIEIQPEWYDRFASMAEKILARKGVDR